MDKWVKDIVEGFLKKRRKIVEIGARTSVHEAITGLARKNLKVDAPAPLLEAYRQEKLIDRAKAEVATAFMTGTMVVRKEDLDNIPAHLHQSHREIVIKKRKKLRK